MILAGTSVAHGRAESRDIITARKMSGLTQKEAALRVGLPMSIYVDYELGVKKVSDEEANRIIQAIKLNETPEPEPVADKPETPDEFMRKLSNAIEQCGLPRGEIARRLGLRGSSSSAYIGKYITMERYPTHAMFLKLQGVVSALKSVKYVPRRAGDWPVKNVKKQPVPDTPSREVKTAKNPFIDNIWHEAYTEGLNAGSERRNAPTGMNFEDYTRWLIQNGGLKLSGDSAVAALSKWARAHMDNDEQARQMFLTILFGLMRGEYAAVSGGV